MPTAHSSGHSGQWWLWLLLSVVLLVSPPTGPAPVSAVEPAGLEFFEQKIRPLLVERCHACHSSQTASPQGGLRLDTRDGLLKGGDSGPAIVPGKPNRSLLIAAVRHQDRVMPPKGPALTAPQIADLVAWVEQGAPLPETPPLPPAARDLQAARQWWAFQPLATTTPPSIQVPGWARSTLDLHVQARLEAAGLTPARRADRQSLLRRVTWDLTGLFPTPAETALFLADSAPDAYDRLVDRLLASPHYGERWGRHWLDVARYADTKDGVLMYGDNRIRPYAYTSRDYVIRALNEDIPYSQFVREQLAADQIVPAVEPWRLGALGLLTLGRMFDNNIHDVIDDRIDTVTRGFLGLTVSCARCHDHKYDPVSMADYYGLYGVFASCEVPLQLPLIEDPRQIPGGPEFEADLANRQKGVQEFLDTQYSLLLETARTRVTDYLVRVATTPADPLETAIFFLSLAPEDLRPPIVARWRRLVEQRAGQNDPVFAPWSALLEKPDAELAQAGVSERVLDELAQRPAGCEPGQLNPLVLTALRESPPRSRAEVATRYGQLLKSVYDGSKPPADAPPNSPAPPAPDAPHQQLLELLVARDSPGWFPRAQTRRYMSRMETDSFGGKVNELDVVAVKSPAAPARAMVLVDSPELHSPRIFLRGNPSRPGPAVERRFLEVLSPAAPAPFLQGSGRLNLADAITSADNPLAGRVIVNRLWMHHFGEPLVGSPSDFGSRTPAPRQLALLDELAHRLIAQNWSLKSLHREIVLSSTYCQASDDRPHCRQVDPENHLLWRMNRRRLDLESMRDTLLQISGRLSCQQGGRPVDAAGSPAEARRTVYGLIDRQNVPGFYRAFDFASPDSSAERRPQTTVPQQALFGLNSPFVFEQCRSLVARLERQGLASPGERITWLYEQVFQRPPSAEERQDAVQFIAAPAAGEGTAPETPLERWEQLAQVLLLSSELQFVD